MAHLSDAPRYLFLWQNGGVYLDLDFVALRSLDGPRNSFVNQDTDDPANGLLFFDRDHVFLLKAMQGCVAGYDPYVWAVIGPKMIGSVYSNLCETSNCSGISALPKELAYPVHYSAWEDCFESKAASGVLKMSREPLAIHFWNDKSSHRQVQTGDGSAYDILARGNCPLSYRIMRLNGFF